MRALKRVSCAVYTETTPLVSGKHVQTYLFKITFFYDFRQSLSKSGTRYKDHRRVLSVMRNVWRSPSLDRFLSGEKLNSRDTREGDVNTDKRRGYKNRRRASEHGPSRERNSVPRL
jgi:hypothetical protein